VRTAAQTVLQVEYRLGIFRPMESRSSTPYVTSKEAALLLRISEHAFLHQINSRRIVFSVATSPETGEQLFLLSDVIYLLQKFTEAPPEVLPSPSDWPDTFSAK
jgi:hypothetical protein